MVPELKSTKHSAIQQPLLSNLHARYDWAFKKKVHKNTQAHNSRCLSWERGRRFHDITQVIDLKFRFGYLLDKIHSSPEIEGVIGVSEFIFLPTRAMRRNLCAIWPYQSMKRVQCTSNDDQGASSGSWDISLSCKWLLRKIVGGQAW